MSLTIASPEGALQKAIVDRLTADAGVQAILGEDFDKRILDEVPNDRDGQRPPYLFFGPIVSRDQPQGCGAAYVVMVRLFAAAEDFGRIGAWNILHAARSALRDSELDLAAPFRCQSFVVAVAGDAAEPERVKSVFLDLVAIVTESL